MPLIKAIKLTHAIKTTSAASQKEVDEPNQSKKDWSQYKIKNSTNPKNQKWFIINKVSNNNNNYY